MRKITLSAVILFVAVNCFSQAASWIWAKNAGSTGYELGQSVVSDAQGNIYVTGDFSSPTMVLGSSTLINAGGYDMFVTKYDVSGNVMWAKSAGGNDFDNGQFVTVDSSGNVYVTGYFTSPTIIFDSITLTNDSINTADVFIVKYDIAGNVIWAHSFGGPGQECGTSIVTDNSGNIYTTGYFTSQSIAIGFDTLSNAGTNSYEMYIIKYNTNGAVIWAKGEGGNASEEATSITMDNSGNIIVLGWFSSPTIVFGSTTLSNFGNKDLFIVKYDSAGTIIWAKNKGGIYDETGYCISTDAVGNIFLTGDFNSPALVFDSTTLINSSGVNHDIFLVKLDESGTTMWARSIGGVNNQLSFSLITDDSGSVYITGDFNSPNITFGSQTLNNLSSYYDLFVAKYDFSGTSIWSYSAGGIYDDVGCSINIDVSGNIIVTGGLQSPYVYFCGPNLVCAGDIDMFIAKLNGTTGIEESRYENERANVYPNPTSGVFTINAEGIEIKEIKVMDVVGQLIINSNSTTIDMSGFAKGIYFLEAIDEKKNVLTKKLVVY